MTKQFHIVYLVVLGKTFQSEERNPLSVFETK